MSEEGVESAPASDEAVVKMTNPLSDGDTEPELVDEADDGFRFLADSWNPGMNAPPDAVVEWMGRTEESILTGGSLRGLQEILGKVLLIAMVSSFLSLGPVIWPFGDPYDLTGRGFLNNTGYFLGYCGVGWGFLWLTNAFWTYRLLNVEFTPNTFVSAVVLPTVFAIVLFLVMYVVLGGPAPVGTLSLGAPCFLVSWIGSYKSQVKLAEVQQGKRGIRTIAVFALWVNILCSCELLPFTLLFVFLCHSRVLLAWYHARTIRRGFYGCTS